jgi:hypothetical protein
MRLNTWRKQHFHLDFVPAYSADKIILGVKGCYGDNPVTRNCLMRRASSQKKQEKPQGKKNRKGELSSL